MSERNYKVGITFGVFDLLHAGHINLIREAYKRCDLLIVAVSKDAYVLNMKNVKPAMPYSVRKAAVKALPFVDRVCEQSHSFNKEDAIRRYKPDVIFVGDDWTPETFKGEGLGLPVIYLPRTEGVSSSDLRKLVNDWVKV